MAKPKWQTSPKVVNYVKRNLETLSISMAVGAVISLKPPWEQERGKKGASTP